MKKTLALALLLSLPMLGQAQDGEKNSGLIKSVSGAVFHDVGDVTSNFKNMTVQHGTGLGVRWFSPVAPFSFDVAYGHQDKKIRWHISLGTRF